MALLKHRSRRPPALTAVVLGHNIWSGGALPVVVTPIRWLMAIRGAVLLALSSSATMKLFEALRYEQLFMSAGSKTKCNTDTFIAEVLQCPRVTSI
jgi:hypothetical protein